MNVFLNNLGIDSNLQEKLKRGLLREEHKKPYGNERGGREGEDLVGRFRPGLADDRRGGRDELFRMGVIKGWVFNLRPARTCVRYEITANWDLNL